MHEFLSYIIGISGGLYLLIQCALAWGWIRLQKTKAKEQRISNKRPPVSVVIAARNEAEHLPLFLPGILTQNYPQYEVILVLDRCEDQSKAIAESLAQQHTSLRIVEIRQTPEAWSPKKWALQQGIDAAQHEWLLFTDADCQVGPQWIAQMSEGMQPGKAVVLGLGKYFAYPGLLNRFIRYETFYTAFQYMGALGIGVPYMAVGRNLAYTKTFFQQAGGFEMVYDRLSGDDDLLINAFAQPEQVAAIWEPEGQSYSEPKRSFRDWLRQKQRHVSASPAYSLRSKLALALFHGAHSCFYGGLLLYFMTLSTESLPLSLYIIRIGVSLGVLIYINRKIRATGLWYAFPLLDFLFFLYNLLVVPLGLIRTPEWKK